MSIDSSTGRNEKSSAKFREHSHGRQDREYTSEQKAAVERIRKCKAHAYYEILSITKEASDGQIKKAYHKLSLATHPDKNGAPGADEAFKMVSKAFQILSDPQKRQIFDSTGSDPDSRSMPSGPSSFSSGGMGGHGGHPFAGMGGFGGSPEISPEDLFNMFFGGGAGFGGGDPFGGAFGNGGATFTFGGPGIRVQQFGGMPRTRRRPQPQSSAGNAQEESPLPSVSRMIWQLLPLIIFFIFPMFTNFLGSIFGLSGGGTRGPGFRMTPDPPFTEVRNTPNYKIPIWINPKEMRDLNYKGQDDFLRKAEANVVSAWADNCRRQKLARDQEIQDAVGIIWTDQARLERAKNRVMPDCVKLEQIGAALPRRG